MTQPARLRLFVALSLPQTELDWVEEVTQDLRCRWPEARWTPRDNRHLTLKFIGHVPVDLVGTIEAACRGAIATVRPNEVRLSGLGAFPRPRRASVLWAGFEDPAGVLTAMAGALDAALGPLGIPPEKRAFRPHLTVARFREPTALGDLPEIGRAPGAFAPQVVGLWRSHLSPKGASYEPVAQFPVEHGS